MRQRETEHERGRGRERGRHRIGSRLQALSHQPRARRGARTHGPRDRDLAEVGRLTDCATQAPPIILKGKTKCCRPPCIIISLTLLWPRRSPFPSLWSHQRDDLTSHREPSDPGTNPALPLPSRLPRGAIEASVSSSVKWG